ncbi:phospholipase D-like domain-containing protein [Chloroflexus aggregans]|uniref:phospholipase D n=1 Tax=Chloroflexus aggregans (strain MD-66 / DSM 9485) TaxID=326427 RepID=B8G8Q9_CHLAD|nr:phospholipase D-like domain-containing protein [Chloroflexus aggregans]ACL24321.1 phospholipase D/Transphosphatidylase [Chloroflexus aggregans DSM 9485]
MARKPSSRAQPRLNRIQIIILFLTLLIGFLVTAGIIDLRRFGLDPTTFGIETPPQPDRSGEITVYFTTPYLVYPDVPRNRVTPPFLQDILQDIANARQSIDLATFEYTLPPLAEALATAHRRGVKVRAALDRESLEDPVDAKFAGILEDAGIPISWEDTQAFLHSKFIIIDNQIVWTGSWNATINDTYRNNNNLLRITIPSLVENYRVEFAEMAAGRFGNSKQAVTPFSRITTPQATIENYFTPRERPASRIVELINGARRSVRFMAFAFTNDEIAGAMITRRQAGVTVQGVFERRNAGGSGSEFALLRDNGVEVLEDGNCYTMHHKVIIIDDRIVITGSYNFTARAERTNDENLLIIDDPVLAAAYLTEFERVFTQAQNPLRCQS